MRSEGPEDPIMEVDSEGHSSSDGGADDEDEAGDIEEDEDEDEEDAEVVADADVEGEGLLASAGEPDEIDEDESLTGDGKLGVSFGGVPTGWSEEDDEESSFDADLFFANLEESSDSDDSPHVLHDAADSDTLSADERDALLLMDVDSSTHIRRSNSDLEFGVSLHGLSFGWEGILSRTDPTSLDVDLGVTTEYDVDMTASSDVESTGDDTTTILEDPGIILDETDGETTEDELVDANGLPNPRAMMLFQWPTTVPVTNQSINPMSTMSSSTSSSHSGTNFSPPLDASPSCSHSACVIFCCPTRIVTSDPG
ncbi:hypothetical protein QCA50_009185 [Cerrena zonata]|uniref:Uncharacterized protein n=1 Tax=Cerrena zonata TaxID=2478898 RepID=A0AAW0G3U7_9APHY